MARAPSEQSEDRVAYYRMATEYGAVDLSTSGRVRAAVGLLVDPTGRESVGWVREKLNVATGEWEPGKTVALPAAHAGEVVRLMARVVADLFGDDALAAS